MSGQHQLLDSGDIISGYVVMPFIASPLTKPTTFDSAGSYDLIVDGGNFSWIRDEPFSPTTSANGCFSELFPLQKSNGTIPQGY